MTSRGAQDEGPDHGPDPSLRAWAQSPVALLCLDGDGAITAANDVFLAWVGRRDVADVEGSRLSSLLSVGAASTGRPTSRRCSGSRGGSRRSRSSCVGRRAGCRSCSPGS
ncbi:hypothetical protein NKG05_17290 [Oerskovia sp. M15]